MAPPGGYGAPPVAAEQGTGNALPKTEIFRDMFLSVSFWVRQIFCTDILPLFLAHQTAPHRPKAVNRSIPQNRK